MKQPSVESRADEELDRVRDEFVQRVSKEMINQLLDKFLSDHVFGYEEMDSIREENHTRANKARSLIDAVIRKGHKACQKMIAYLQSKDPMLFQQLGLSSAQPSHSGDCVDNSEKKPKKTEHSGRIKKEEEEETACKRARQQDKSDEVKSGQTRSQDLSEKQLLLVAQQLGVEWKQVAIYLGLKSKDLDDLEEAEKNVIMRKQKMLLKWKRKMKPGEATAYHLQKSLKNMEDLPHKVHEILKDMVDDMEDDAVK